MKSWKKNFFLIIFCHFTFVFEQKKKKMNCFICSVENPELFWTVENKATKGSTIALKKFNGSPEQQFQVFTNYILAGCSGLAIDYNGGAKEGTNVIQWDFHGNSNQQFHLTREGYIQAQNLVVGVNASQENQKLIATKPAKKPSQMWRLVTRKP